MSKARRSTPPPPQAGPATPSPEVEQHYLNLLLDPLDACASYKPKFGTDEDDGISLEQFQTMYGADPFYHWVGLDSPLMYAAHKAAGGMTSVYRQLGAGCERLFRAVIRDSLALTDGQVIWSYQFDKDDGTTGTAILDARIDVADLEDKPEAHRKMVDWLRRCGVFLELPADRIAQLRGRVSAPSRDCVSALSREQRSVPSARRDISLPFGSER